MKAAAQTVVRAVQAIDNLYGDIHIRCGIGTCECGETERVLSYHYGELIASVTICKVCGDDTLTDEELTKITNQ